MNDKQLFKEFKKISLFKPDQAWKAKNRELLLNQISSTQNVEKTGCFNFALKSFSLIPQSAMVAVFILAIVLGGGFLGLHASQNTVPGDSLYATKIFGEKAQFVFTFNNKNKASLSLEFAGNRAKEINQVLADTDVIEDKDEKVEKLVIDFRKEIDGAKSRLEKINQNSEPLNNEKPLAVDNENNNNLEQVQTEEVELAQNDSEANEEDSHVFSANLGRDDNGLDVYDPNASKNGEGAVLNTDEETALVNEVSESAGTSEDEIMEVPDAPAANPEEMLKQAGDLLDGDNIGATLNLIEEAGQVIDQIEENSGATSTEDLKTEALEAEESAATTSEATNE